MTTFKLGKLSIDAVAYGSQGNAILGIRDSGKTYTATFMAERLFEAGIPFIAFDPIGVWRFLKVPGKGRGYPVVIAGGAVPDLPLTVAGAPEIVRAAMRNGVSLVIDLFDMKLSKGDWRKIVTEAVKVLLHENQAHGLRHVFLEEAAEFIPQKPNDWVVYAEIEKLARMGGNSRLGYTLINQRSQEVSKAILELCENVFLHRQRGKNALENMDKWLAIAGAAEQKEIIKSLPDLPQGECWAWLGGDKPMPPQHITVPAKNSLHPDRRVMHGDKGVEVKKAVDVGKFVAGMKTTLVKVEEEDKANNPKLLRAEIARLTAELTSGVPAMAAIAMAEERGFRRGEAEAAPIWFRRGVEVTVSKIGDTIKQFEAAPFILKELKGWETLGAFQPAPAPAAGLRTSAPPRPAFAPRGKPVADGNLERPLQKIVDAIRWWNVMGVAAPSHAQVAFMAGYSHKSGTWATYLSRLRADGLIEGRGDLVLTESGGLAANDPAAPPTGEALRAIVVGKMDGPLQRILAPIFEAYPSGLSHQQAADAAGYSHSSGTWATYLSRLRSLDLIDGRGELRAQDWLFPFARIAA